MKKSLILIIMVSLSACQTTNSNSTATILNDRVKSNVGHVVNTSFDPNNIGPKSRVINNAVRSTGLAVISNEAFGNPNELWNGPSVKHQLERKGLNSIRRSLNDLISND